MTKLYLSSDSLAWKKFDSGSSLCSDDKWKRCYLYWAHAERLLSHNDESLYLIDCVANLNRAIDHRLKLLASCYRLKKLPKFGQAKDTLGMLEDLNIARPYMLQQINSLRNLMEHQYTDPPNLNRCRELTELTWYFLKSTDSLCTEIKDSFEFELDGDDASYWLAVNYGPDSDWRCEIRGWVSAQMVHPAAGGKTLEIDAESTTTAADAKLKESVMSSATSRIDDDIYFSGTLNFDPASAKMLTQLYFAV